MSSTKVNSKVSSKTVNFNDEKKNKQIKNSKKGDSNSKPKTSISIENKVKEVVILNENQTLINTFDFTAIDQLDPLLSEGHRQIFNKDVIMEVRKNNAKLEEKIKFRMLLIGEEVVPSNVRIELTSEEDIFFFYLCEFDIFSFRKLQETQKIQCNFGEFIPTIKKLVSVSSDIKQNDENLLVITSSNFNNNTNSYNKTSSSFNNNNNNNNQTFSSPSKDGLNFSGRNTLSQNQNQTFSTSSSTTKNDKYKMVLNIVSLESANLEFVKILGHKEITVLTINFVPISSDFMRKMISYRFNYTRSKIIVYQERLNYVIGLVEEKNPQLFDQVTKLPARLTEDFIKSKLKNY